MFSRSFEVIFCVVDVSLVRRVEVKLLLLEVVAWVEIASTFKIRTMVRGWDV